MGWVDCGFCKIWCQLQIKIVLKQYEVLDRLEADCTASKVVRLLDDTTSSVNNISFPLTSDAFKFFYEMSDISQEIQLSAQILRVRDFVHCVTVPTCKEAKTSPHCLIISNTIDFSTVPSVELPVMQIVSYHVFLS